MAVMRYLRIGNNRYEIADEKLKVSEITSGITYYPILGSGMVNTTSSRQWDSTGLQYDSFEGEEEGEGGNASLSLGNYIPVGEVGSKRGTLILYGEEGSYSVLQSSTTGEGTGYYILLPDKQGTVALTDDIPTKLSQLENDSEFITEYTETDPTVPAWAKARTKPTYTAQEVGAVSSVMVSRALVEGTKSATITVDGTSYDIYSNPGTITNIKTTAGAHTTIDVSSGAVSFNIPTTAAHVGIKFGYTTSGNNRAVLQDSSGNLYVTQKDDNTNTTYTLSGALSSHKFTSTLTAGGSGSGTSTSELTFAAGTGITLTDDTTNKKITIAASHNGTVTSVAASGSGGITISGSPITSSGTITIGLNLSTAINGLSEGASPATINDYAVVQYAGGGTTTTTYHRRKLSNLIVGKAVSDQNGLRIDTGYLKLTGGSVTGPTTFGDTVSIDDLNAGQLVVNGSASVTNNLQVNTINGVVVGSNPKFTDTVTTATTTGSGNAVTAITASNGALTVTKGATFLTSHNTYTVSTTGTGNAVTAVSLSGTTFTVTKGATYSNNTGTITSVKTTAGAHTIINVTSGAASFNIPTHTSHLTNDSGYLTNSTLYEGRLNWGNINLTGNVTPIGMSLSAEHSANRIAYLNPAAVQIEYTTNGGSSWADSGYTNDEKMWLCTGSTGIAVGQSKSGYSQSTALTTNHWTRITLTGQNGTTQYVYTSPRKLLVNVSTAIGLNCLVEYKTGVSGASWQTFGTYAVSGWSGWNDIPLILSTFGGGSTQTSNYWYLRFTFKVTSTRTDSYKGYVQVLGLRLFGATDWSSASSNNSKGPFSSTGHLYSYDVGANAIFPAQITATQFNGKATQVRDSSNGNAITITYGKAGQSSTSWLASWNGYELGAISPANITAGNASKINGRSITVSTSGPSGGSNGDLWFTYTA